MLPDGEDRRVTHIIYVETANLLAHLGEPLKPLSTLPPPTQATNGRPTTPSRLSQPPDSDDERENTANTGPVWTAAKRDEMKKKLTNVIEELVRTERSYLSRIHALKSVSRHHMSRARACADIQFRPTPTDCDFTPRIRTSN